MEKIIRSFDHIIIGAGYAGSIIAERIASKLGQRVLIIEKRNHIAGNAYDYYDENGILIHKYGPHIFHTNNKQVWDYLSDFTDWFYYHHRVRALIDGKEISLPFSFKSIAELFPLDLQKKLEQKLLSNFEFNTKVPILKLREIEDTDLKFLADYIYEKVFKGYTTKQWGVVPEELNPLVTDRVPVYLSQDDRYFQDHYQGLPAQGYTKMFENILSHKNISVLLNTDFRDILKIDTEKKKVYLFDTKFEGKVIYTGMLDELYDYSFGELPYRSLDFRFQHLNQEYFLKSGSVNYPTNYDHTRITEFKHLTGQKHQGTTIVYEYPQQYDRHTRGKDIPYYPVPQEANHKLYKKYKDQAKEFKQLILVGRLAEYHYYDMHQIVAQALKVFRREFNNIA